MTNEYDQKIMQSVPFRLAHSPRIIVFRSFIESLKDLDSEWNGRPSEKLYLLIIIIAS